MPTHHKRKSKTVRLLKDVPDGGSEYTTLNRARRLEKAGRGKLNEEHMVFLFFGSNRGPARANLPMIPKSAPVICDARPGMPILPPSPAVLAKLTSRYRPAHEVLAANAARARAEMAG
jgi:hypothetical protein